MPNLPFYTVTLFCFSWVFLRQQEQLCCVTLFRCSDYRISTLFVDQTCLADNRHSGLFFCRKLFRPGKSIKRCITSISNKLFYLLRRCIRKNKNYYILGKKTRVAISFRLGFTATPMLTP